MTTGEATKPRSRALVQSIRSSTWGSRLAVALLAVLLVVLLVQAVREPAQFTAQLVIGITNGAIIALVALGYTLVYGIIELINFAHGDNFMIGSFVGLTVLSGTIFGLGLFAPITGGELQGIHISFWLILIIAGAFTGLCGIIISAPTLRLRGDYLAIITLGFGEIIPKFFQNGDDLAGFNLTNGTIGIKVIDSPGFPFLPESLAAWQRFGTLDLNPWYYTIVVLVLVTVYVNIRLRDSRLGRAWISVREDETAASAMGINPVTTKLWAYAMGAVFGGLAGAYYGAFIKNIFPTSFSFNISILILSMVILGGMGSIYGVILGAVALQGLNFYLLPQINGWIHAIGDAVGSAALSNADVPKYNFFLFGILLVVMMLLRPEGIIPNRQRAEELHEPGAATR